MKPAFQHETKSHVWKDAVLPLGEPCRHNRWLKRFHFREDVWSFFEKSFDGHGDPWMHLIVGPEKALLIDNGFGIGDLKSEVEEIIGDKPLYVTNTHPSIDHSRGNFQFDRVHVIEYMVPYLEKDNPHMWDRLYDPETGKGIWQPFDKSEIVPFRKYEIVGVPNHYVFDLGGGHEVELIHLPGHHAAHCAFLDRKNRILFGGDSLLFICSVDKGNNVGMPYDEYGTVEGIKNELAHLVKRMDEFDCVFMSHMILGEDKRIVRDLYEACCEVVADPDSNQWERQLPDGRILRTRSYGTMAVEYVPERVYKSQITHGKPTFQHEWQSMEWGKAIVPLARHYACHPYAQVYQFRENIWSIRIRTVWSTIIVGPERAMLIDTGYGAGDMKQLVKELIGDMELIVVNTHTHGDHTLGNVQFEKVYMHKYAVPTMQKYQDERDERKWRYYNEPVKALQRYMKNNGAFEEKDMQPFRPYEMVGCENHTVWNLGGDHEVELIYLPGHDYAGCVFLDRKNRILFGGDSLLYVAGMGGNPQTGGRPPKMPYSEYACVEAFHNELQELVKRMDEFDCIFMGHMVQGADKRLVTDMYECTKRIMADPKANPYVNVRKNCLNRVVACGQGAVEYCDSRVYIDRERTV